MTENFETLLNESLKQIDLRPGAVVKAKIVDIRPEAVVVSAGLKSESPIPIEEFKSPLGELEVAVGDEIEVSVEAIENGFGETRLSREKAKRSETWRKLDTAHKAGETVKGVITERVKGGFTVALDSVKAFLPGSLVDVRPIRDPSYLEGKELDFKIIKMDRRRNNVVVSRRAVVEQESVAERAAVIEKLSEGQEIVGVVKNLTDYGAFIDLGGVDGLLHITDMSWKRIKHPSEMLKVGEEIRVKVLSFDRDKNRVSLGMKQLAEDPWADVARRYPVNSRMHGKVTNVTDYGCFVELEPGIEGLVHMSEMDWTNKNINPAKVVQLGDEVEVMVLEVDEQRRRISLGLKQCKRNPWEEYSAMHQVGEKVKGPIRSITDFGVFVGLEGGIDGLIHMSDISWNEPAEKAARSYKKGEEIEAVILAIDPERERISLGIKQLEEDPFTLYVKKNPKETVVKGKVTNVDAKGATVHLADNVEGYLKASEISIGRISDAREYLQPEEEIEAKIISVDRKNRIVNLSIKELQKSEAGEPMKTTLGDLLKEKMSEKESE